jgi:hypothetical protein
MGGTALNPKAVSFAIVQMSDTRDAKNVSHYTETVTETKADLLDALLATLRMENEKPDEREPVDEFLARLEAERTSSAIPRIAADDTKVSFSLSVMLKSYE